MATLTIQFPEPLTYNLGWTLSRWAGGWQTLDLSGEPGPVYRLPLGQYRLMTVNRLPNGNQLARFTPFAFSLRVRRWKPSGGREAWNRCWPGSPSSHR